MGLDPTVLTTAASSPGASNVLVNSSSIANWVIAIGSVWVVLTLGVDIGATRDLSVAFAFLFMGSVFIIHGPDALKNLGFIA